MSMPKLSTEAFELLEEKWNTDVAETIDNWHEEIINAPTRFDNLLEQSKEFPCQFSLENIRFFTGDNFEHVLRAISRSGLDHNNHLYELFSSGWLYEYAQETARITRMMLYVFNINMLSQPEALRLVETVIAAKANLKPMDVVYARLTGLYVFQQMPIEQTRVMRVFNNNHRYQALYDQYNHFLTGNVEVIEIPAFVLPPPAIAMDEDAIATPRSLRNENPNAPAAPRRVRSRFFN